MAIHLSAGQHGHSGTRIDRVVLIGGGEHAVVVGEAARSAGDQWLVCGVVDPGRAERAGAALAVPYLGDDDEFAGWLSAQERLDQPALVLAVGGSRDRDLRRALAARYAACRWATITHVSAWVSPTATVGDGTVILAGAIVNAGAVLGPHSIVNSGAVIEHDVVVGAFAHVAPGAVIGGGATIGQGAFVGLGACVRDHVVVGDAATVGMGAVVVSDVPGGVTVVGVPARPMGGR